MYEIVIIGPITPVHAGTYANIGPGPTTISTSVPMVMR
jgi:hypothetical protein